MKIILSRSHPELIRRLFEREVPEVGERTIEIRALAREAGARTKLAVASIDAKVDAVGACVGVRGSRIKNIVEELGGEKIDIVRWNESSQILIANALKPAEVAEVSLCFELGRATVVVNEDQLSLAIGKRGQNVRLAARLTGWDVDIITPQEFNGNIERLERILRQVPEVAENQDLVDKIIALGLIDVRDIEEVGEQPLMDELEVEYELAERMVDVCTEEAKIVVKEQEAKKKAEAEAKAAGLQGATGARNALLGNLPPGGGAADNPLLAAREPGRRRRRRQPDAAAGRGEFGARGRDRRGREPVGAGRRGTRPSTRRAPTSTSRATPPRSSPTTSGPPLAARTSFPPRNGRSTAPTASCSTPTRTPTRPRRSTPTSSPRRPPWPRAGSRRRRRDFPVGGQNPGGGAVRRETFSAARLHWRPRSRYRRRRRRRDPRRRAGPGRSAHESYTSGNDPREHALAKGIRISALAKELGVKSKDVLDKLRDEGLGEQYSNHQTTVGAGLQASIPPVVRRRGDRGRRGRRGRRRAPEGQDAKEVRQEEGPQEGRDARRRGEALLQRRGRGQADAAARAAAGTAAPAPAGTAAAGVRDHAPSGPARRSRGRARTWADATPRPAA